MAWPASPKPMKHQRGVLWVVMGRVLAVAGPRSGPSIAEEACGFQPLVFGVCPDHFLPKALYGRCNAPKF
jgi:hypothetical protein